MKLKVNGKPYIYKHDCDEDDYGRPLSREEMQEFVTSCLIESFEMRGTLCVRHTPDFNSGADFSFKKHGRTICGVVAYYESEEEGSEIIKDIYGNKYRTLRPELYENFEEHGSWPVFYLPDVKCLDTDDNTSISGGSYEIQFLPIHYPYPLISSSAGKLSDFELYQGYANSWATGDSEFLRDHVKEIFRGNSDFSFDEIYSKADLIEHFEFLNADLLSKGVVTTAELIKSNDDDSRGILIRRNGKDLCYVTLLFSDHEISHSHTRRVPDEYEPWTVKHELYQTHGDHHAPFVQDSELGKFLGEMMKGSKVALKALTEVTLDGDRKQKALVYALRYTEECDVDTISYLALIAYDAERNVNEFVSCYPLMDGTPILVEIMDVLEWDNRIEATVECRYRNNGKSFDFHFFATDYFFNKSKYRIGEKIEVAIAASSGNAKIASKGFTFEGQQAIDFLSKLGKEPDYDEEGEVMPVNFSTEKLIAFLPNDDKCPDMAEFQSPVEYDGSRYEFYNAAPNVAMITINADTELSIPLYFNEDCDPEDGEGISGYLWLTGRLADPCGKTHYAILSEGETLFGQNGPIASFISMVKDIKLRPWIDITMAVDLLDAVTIPESSNVFAVKVKSEDIYHYIPICCDLGEMISASSETLSNGYLSAKLAECLPSILETLEVECNKRSIIQAFVLFIADKILPHSGYYTHSNLILSSADLEDHFGRVWIRQQELLLPKVYINAQESGFISYIDKRGDDMYRMAYSFIINNGHISFIWDGCYKVSNSVFDDEDDVYVLYRD